jgi:hypothetical protein
MRHILYSVAVLLALTLVMGCAQQESSSDAEQAAAVAASKVTYETPAALDVPATMVPADENDWAAKVNNKNAEIIGVLNILNPVAAYLTAAFEQYGTKFSQTTNEEWTDTVAQLTAANTIYGECKESMDQGKADKDLFLKLEEAWQIYVKVGVAGIRTKSMVDSELASL